jgi:glycosyltransferase involved in cell wall biosynthesis
MRTASIEPDRDKRLLLVAYDYPPEKTAGVYRTTAITRQLQKRGWSVSVLTVRGTRGTRPFDDVELIPDSIRVIRTWSGFHYWRLKRRIMGVLRNKEASAQAQVDSNPRSVPSRRPRRSKMRRVFERLLTFPDSRAGWFFPLLFRAAVAMARHRYPVVLSSSPPHSSHLPIRLLKMLFQFRWVVDFRDPWTAPPRASFGRAGRAIQRRLEGWVLAASDVILANTPGNKRALQSNFAGETDGKIQVLTNGYDGSLFDRADRQTRFDFDCDLVYVGHMYPHMFRLYIEVLDAIRRGGGEIPRLHVYDKPPAPVVIRGLHSGGHVEHIMFKNEVSYLDSISIIQQAPALLLLLPHGRTMASWVPSKLYSYMNSGRPIVAIVTDGDAATMLDEVGVGTVIRSPEPAVIAEQLISFLAAVKSGTIELHPDRARIERYSWDSLGERLSALLLDQLQSRLVGSRAEHELP